MVSRRRVLVVTPFPPRRDAPHGGGRITAEAIEHLAGRFDVALLALRAEGEAATEPRLAERGVLVVEVPRASVGTSPRRLWVERRRIGLALRRRPGWAVGHSVAAARTRLAELVRSWGPDVVQIEYLVLADLASAIPAPGPPVVLVEHDARPPAATGADKQWRGVRRAAASRVDAVVAFSPEDARVVTRGAGAAQVVVIPPGLDLPPAADGAGTGEELLFVGGFGHPPNVDAAFRLVREILPRVRARRPAAVLTLVGADPPSELAGEGVVVVGRVPDVGPYLERAAVVVAPVAEGGGVRIKVIEALASGKAVVASTRAIEGIDVRPGEHLLVADGEDETAAVLVKALEDAELRRRLGAAARAWAEHALRWGDRIDRYEALYERLLAERRGAH